MCKVTFSVNELLFFVGTHQLFTTKPIYSAIILMDCENHTKNDFKISIFMVQGKHIAYEENILDKEN